MEKATALWGALMRHLQPLLERLDALAADTWRLAEGPPGGLDWRLAAAAAACTALLWLSLGKLGGRRATREALEAQAVRLAAAGVKQEERACRLLRQRRDWKRLPVGFLWELCNRLRDEDQVWAFVVLAERHGLQCGALRRIARKHRPAAAMSAVAVLLNGLKSRRQGETRTASALAMRLDAEDPRSVLTLATDCYHMARYEEALSLLTLGITLCRKLLDHQDAATSQDKRRRKRSRREPGLSSAELRARLKRALAMYEDCRLHVRPART